MMGRIVRDASDPAQVKRANDEAEDRVKDLAFLLKEPRGRRWVYNLVFNTCHVDAQSHVIGDHDQTIFNEGGRSVGLKLLEEIRVFHPKAHAQMLEENHYEH